MSTNPSMRANVTLLPPDWNKHASLSTVEPGGTGLGPSPTGPHAAGSSGLGSAGAENGPGGPGLDTVDHLCRVAPACMAIAGTKAHGGSGRSAPAKTAAARPAPAAAAKPAPGGDDWGLDALPDALPEPVPLRPPPVSPNSTRSPSTPASPGASPAPGHRTHALAWVPAPPSSQSSSPPAWPPPPPTRSSGGPGSRPSSGTVLLTSPLAPRSPSSATTPKAAAFAAPPSSPAFPLTSGSESVRPPSGLSPFGEPESLLVSTRSDSEALEQTGLLAPRGPPPSPASQSLVKLAAGSPGPGLGARAAGARTPPSAPPPPNVWIPDQEVRLEDLELDGHDGVPHPDELYTM